MSERKTGAAGVAEAVEKVLGKFYPSGIATKVLRKQLEDSGFSAKEISNGVYKLTSGGVVERDKEDDCFYLVNAPDLLTPDPTPTPIEEPIVLSPAELDALAQVNRPATTPEPDLAILAIEKLKARIANRVVDVERKVKALASLGAILDPSIAELLEQICDDLTANAA